MSNRIKPLCYGGLFVALTALGTMVLHIPTPATNGYIHIGDSIILLISFLFGYKYGVVSAGLGSALADILTGYAHWAPFTLIIKALMALVAAKLSDSDKPVVSVKNIVAVLLAEAVMITGYFLAASLMTGSALVALQEVPANLIQGSGGIIVFSVAGAAFKKAGIARYFKAH